MNCHTAVISCIKEIAQNFNAEFAKFFRKAREERSQRNLIAFGFLVSEIIVL
jgi:hypothetical protein